MDLFYVLDQRLAASKAIVKEKKKEKKSSFHKV
jgi:hypothetical protein